MEIFTSFASLEVRMLILEADILLNEQNTKKAFTNSVFKDEEIRTLIMRKTHFLMQRFLSSNSKDLPQLPKKIGKNEKDVQNVFVQKDKEGSPMKSEDGKISTFKLTINDPKDLVELRSM